MCRLLQTLAVNTALVALLDAADISDWPAIFLGSTNLANSKLTSPGADTNYALLTLALASIKRNLGTSPVILFTGDFLGHGIDQLYPKYSVNQTADEAAAFVDKTLTFVLQQIRAACGDIPVLFAVGNCDSYTGYGPDSKFLANNAAQLYSTMLKGVANEQDFLSTFKAGGYYAAEPLGKNLMVISLDTMPLSPLVQANGDASESDQAAVDAELAWFDTKLAAAQAAGQKVWLLMHAPPGADEGTTAGNITSAGHLSAATMMWEPNYQSSFMRILQKYPGVIAMTLAGHTHMDEYRIVLPNTLLEITPAISPVFTNDPAYKVFTLDRQTLAPSDFRSISCDLSKTPAQFSDYYTFSKAYFMSGSLPVFLTGMLPQLVTNSQLQALYRGYYYSGNNSPSPLTDLKWPAYWAGIGIMWEQELTNAVNSYS
jgi:sphingomyelin phosphodiesterase acid-like 3